jgi:myo-inositol-1(or 4)-monophosphatase
MNDKIFTKILSLTIEAGKILRKNFYLKKSIKMKNEREIVTNTDYEIEKFIIENLKAEFPELKFLAEEKHIDENINSDKLIVLDPVDGTNNFFYKLPYLAISIAYYENGIGRFGIVFNPILDEMFVGIKGEGAYLNNKMINVSKTSKIKDALLATGLPYNRDKENNLNNIKKFGLICRDIRRFGSAALDICYTAKGTFDGYWELGLKPWDVAAGLIILREAGGKMTNFYNDELDLSDSHFLATNGLLHSKMQKILKEEV